MPVYVNSEKGDVVLKSIGSLLAIALLVLGGLVLLGRVSQSEVATTAQASYKWAHNQVLNLPLINDAKREPKAVLPKSSLTTEAPTPPATTTPVVPVDPGVTGGTSPDASAAPTPAKLTPGMVYVLGDSLAQGLRTDKFWNRFPAEWRISLRALKSRTILGGPSPSGYQRVWKDRKLLVQAKAVVVMLGTNPENHFKGAARKLIKRLRSHTLVDTPIYWVNVGRKKVLTRSMRRTHQAIQDLATELSFNEINWHGLALNNPEWFARDSLHLDSAGYKELGNVIIRSVTGAQPVS